MIVASTCQGPHAKSSNSDSVVTLTGNGDSAVQLLARVSEAGPIISAKYVQDDMRQLLARSKQAGKKELFEEVLSGKLVPDEEHTATLKEAVSELTANAYDRRVSRSRKGKEKKWQAAHAKRRALQNETAASLLARQYSKNSMPPLSLAQGMENLWTGTSRTDWERQRMAGLVPGESYIHRGLEAIGHWVPPINLKFDDVVSTDYGIYVRDNLEFWMRYKAARFVNGEWKKSNIIHTVTGANVYVGCRHVTAPVPVLPETMPETVTPWPIMDEWDVRNALLTREAVDAFFKPVWDRALRLVRESPSGLLQRPPPEEDFEHPRHPPPPLCH